MPQISRLGRTATTVHANDHGEMVVTYHSTAVVTFTEKKVKLDSGGWRTATTRTRMNQAANQFGLPYNVFQKASEWFVSVGDKVIPFTDGMTIPR